VVEALTQGSPTTTSRFTADRWEDADAAFDGGDYETAFQLYQSLAKQGDAQAHNQLGAMYEHGTGVSQDRAEARKWYLTAFQLYRPLAEQGDVGAQSRLGFMHYTGKGVPKDYTKAAKWFRKTAAQGDAVAMSRLGVMHYSGNGVPQDLVRAHMWFDLAASQGNERAAASREELAKKLTPDQIAEAQKLAREWKASQ
jgi:hypothetical protein